MPVARKRCSKNTARDYVDYVIHDNKFTACDNITESVACCKFQTLN